MNRFLPMLVAGVIGGLVVFGAVKLTETPATQAQTNVAPAAKQVSYAGAPPAFDFTKAAEKSLNAVVHIKATESRKSAIERNRQNPFFYFFGGPDFGQRSGTGSGVIYTSDGYILTNNHVIDFADEFEVTLHDNREFKARLVGRDADTDMAVIKIDATNLDAIELSNSDEVKVGEWVLAVGNPFDLSSTVTAGIVSAKGRDINIIKGYSPIESFIQTDAAVNPGNSGGALVDINGRLVGINSAIATPTGTYAGYSFAIPVNLAKRIADDLIKYGEYRRAYLGVDIATMDGHLAEQLNMEFTPGVYVAEVLNGGSAAAAGIQSGDVITKINGKNVTSLPELREMVGRSKVGDTLVVLVKRKNKEFEIPVKLRVRNG
jgi:Do/DeqQ family serine protease